MTSTVRVEVPGAAYDVVIGEGLLAEAGTRLQEVITGRKVALVSDAQVIERYGMPVLTALARAEFTVIDLSVPAGESSKNWALAGQLVEQFAASRLGREDAVIALGGGVVGDLAGFCAAVYQRGIDFVQVPTTLLAMVDSSVGGKTAVDLTAGKNLAGAFKQPLVVIADIATLSTLPDAEWRSGLAEVAKSAVLDSEEFVAFLESSASLLDDRDAAVVAQTVERCVRFKAAVVARDEKEEGPRECLNYGHTLGHALEKVGGYGSMTHGAAVAEGMRFAARVAADVLGAPADFVKRQDRLLDALSLPATETPLPARELLDAMHGDKKARGGTVRMVLSSGPGSWECIPVPDAAILAHLEQWVASKARREP